MLTNPGMMEGVPVEKLTPERRRQLTRQTLIEAAAEVFAQKGFYGASLEEIGEVAGFSRGAIYSNFGSKEELLFGVLDHYMDIQLDAVMTAMEATGRADVVADAVAATAAWESANRFTSNWPGLALELRLAALRNPEVRKRLVDFERKSGERVARVIEEEWARRGVQPRISARDFADLSRAAIEGLTQLAAIDEEDSSRYRRLVGELFLLLASAVFEPEDM
jgi:AcrR family transcriptional regulator